MKLYLLSQDVNNDYDTYDSCVVAAKSAKEAKLMTPGSSSYDWCKPDDVKVQYIGEAKRGTKKGEIISSFNAG